MNKRQISMKKQQNILTENTEENGTAGTESRQTVSECKPPATLDKGKPLRGGYRPLWLGIYEQTARAACF